jgi:hypothetical protein
MVTNQMELDVTIRFLEEIGIPVYAIDTPVEGFLPGLSIRDGAIHVHYPDLLYPGDILHEAGHIAVVPAAERKQLNQQNIAKRFMREGEEMMAIAWSYAACMHLDLDSRFVFHDNGYGGGGSSLADNFDNGYYFGVPMLQWAGMTLEEKHANGKKQQPYPAMQRWLRE